MSQQDPQSLHPLEDHAAMRLVKISCLNLTYDSNFPAYSWSCKHLKYLDRLGVRIEGMGFLAIVLSLVTSSEKCKEKVIKWLPVEKAPF